MVKAGYVLASIAITGFAAYILGVRNSFETVKSRMCTNPLDFSAHMATYVTQCPNPKVGDMVNYFAQAGTNSVEQFMFEVTSKTL